MVFPRAMIRQLVPQLGLQQLEALSSLFIYFFKQIRVFACAPQSRVTGKLDLDVGLGGRARQVVAGLLCIIVFCPLHAWKPAQLRSSLVCEAE